MGIDWTVCVSLVGSFTVFCQMKRNKWFKFDTCKSYFRLYRF